MNCEGEGRLVRRGRGGRDTEHARPARLLLVSGLTAVVMLLPAASAPAQEQQAALPPHDEAAAAAHADAPAAVARKIDEFGSVGGCDHGARLDNFAIDLMNNPGHLGYVIVYGPAGRANGSAYYRGEVTRNYLAQTRGIDPARLKVINGGRYKEMDETMTELWAVPPGAEPPRPVEFENRASTFRGLFTEYEAWDAPLYYDSDLGPPVGNAKFAGFVDSVFSQPEARAYVVTFNGEESPPGAWRRVAERVTWELEQAGVGGARVGVIFGGRAKQLKVQLWVSAADAPPPVADAGPEPPPAAAAQLGSFDHHMLRHEENQRYVVKGLGDVLKNDEKLTAYLFIREASPDEEAEEESGGEEEAGAVAESGGVEARVEDAAGDEAAPKPDEADETGETSDPPAVDMEQLAERWREELREKYGVADYRVIVIKVPPRGEGETAGIETWVVPPGAAAPDPYAEPPAVEAADEEAVEEKNEGATENGSDGSDPDRAQAVRRREV
jgi:hypothetical protein